MIFSRLELLALQNFCWALHCLVGRCAALLLADVFDVLALPHVVCTIRWLRESLRWASLIGKTSSDQCQCLHC